MSAPIGPGDWVECVGEWPSVGFARGSLWFCEGVEGVPAEAICGECDEAGGVALVLAGYALKAGYEGVCPCGFRPIYRPQEHAFDYLLENLPADVDAREPAFAAPSRRAPHEVHPEFRESQ